MDVVGPHFKAALTSLNHNVAYTNHWNVEVDEFKYEFDCYFKMCFHCVGTAEPML